jgi:hypothetical protein
VSIKYNHGVTLAYEVISDNPDEPTLAEALAALRQRIEGLIADPEEAEEALLSELPFDTFAFDQEEGA